MSYEGPNNPRWKGGRSRGYILKLAKKALQERGVDFSKCEICKRDITNVRWEIHHINGNNQDNSPYNVILLCPSCHRKMHSERKGEWVTCAWCGKPAGYRKPSELKEVHFCCAYHQRLWVMKYVVNNRH